MVRRLFFFCLFQESILVFLGSFMFHQCRGYLGLREVWVCVRIRLLWASFIIRCAFGVVCRTWPVGFTCLEDKELVCGIDLRGRARVKRRVMDSKRRWFQKFQLREKTRSTAKKKDSSSLEREDKSPTSEEEKPSTVTRQKAAVAGHSEPLQGAEE